MPINVDGKTEGKSSLDMPSLLSIHEGYFHAFFIYDVANTIDLANLQLLAKTSFSRTPFDFNSEHTTNLQVSSTPIMTILPEVVLEEQTARITLKAFECGAISIRLSFGYRGSLNDFACMMQTLRLSRELEKCAEKVLSELLESVDQSLNKRHKPLLEDYFIVELRSSEPAMTSKDLLSERIQLSSLILSESRHLSGIEQEEALRLHFSYFDNDLVIIHWDSALVYDSKEGAEAIINILELANVQLVELRTYDARLDAELDEIYKWDASTLRQQKWFLGARSAQQRTAKLRRLKLDIRELADRGSNALKLIGDAYYARVYRGAVQRFCLSDWQQQIETKLNSVGEIYRFATDEAQHARSEFLEIIIIVLITVEILMVIFGVGR